MEVQLLISFNEERLFYLDDAGIEQHHAQLRARSHLPLPHAYALHAPPTPHPSGHDPSTIYSHVIPITHAFHHVVQSVLARYLNVIHGPSGTVISCSRTSLPLKKHCMGQLVDECKPWDRRQLTICLLRKTGRDGRGFHHPKIVEHVRILPWRFMPQAALKIDRYASPASSCRRALESVSKIVKERESFSQDNLPCLGESTLVSSQVTLPMRTRADDVSSPSPSTSPTRSQESSESSERSQLPLIAGGGMLEVEAR
jgi:hypothetical protein